MAVWSVRTDKGRIDLGGHRRKMLTGNGCNEPFMNSFWCPKRRWFRKEPCPFASKNECETYTRFCGAL